MEHSINTEEELREYDIVEGADNGAPEEKKSTVSSRDKQFSSAVLLGGNEGSGISEKFLEHDIPFNSLASLSAQDLEMLGIVDDEVRNKMLEQFAELPNQAPDFKRLLAEADLDQYQVDVLKGLSEHVESLKTSVAAAEIKLLLNKTEDVLINDFTYSSEMVIRVLQEMTRNATIMEKYLVDLKEGSINENFLEESINSSASSSSSSVNIMKNVVIVSGIIGLGLIVFKIVKSKFKF